jgi:hypothetical protein
VTAFVADTLHCEDAAAEPLARLVHQKTLGNPLFAIQFLTALREEHLLAFDASAAIWRWDLDRIRDRGFTDNVVDLMVGKLERLPASTQDILKNSSPALAAVLTSPRLPSFMEPRRRRFTWICGRLSVLSSSRAGRMRIHFATTVFRKPSMP